MRATFDHDKSDKGTSTTYDLLPLGDYRAKIIAATVEDISRKFAYGQCLKLIWQIETGPHDGRLLWQRIHLWAQNMPKIDKVLQMANRDFAAIRKATGVLTPNSCDHLLHHVCTLQVGLHKDQNAKDQKDKDKNDRDRLYNIIKTVKAVCG